MQAIFPLSYLSSQLSMTVLLVFLGLTNHTYLAVGVAIVQAAAAAVLLSFSANARNLILLSSDVAIVKTITIARFILFIPLGIAVYYLSSMMGGIDQKIAAVLVVRKLVEWIMEIYLAESERLVDKASAYKHLFIESLLLSIVMIGVASDSPYLFFILCIWAASPIFLSLQVLTRILKGPSQKNSLSMLIPHFGSTAAVGLGVYVFRISILLLAGASLASDMYTAFAIGGVFTSIFIQGFGQSLTLHQQRSNNYATPNWLRIGLWLIALSGLLIVGVAQLPINQSILFGKPTIFWQALGLSLMGGLLMLWAHLIRLRNIQHDSHRDVFAADALVNMLIVLFVPGVYFLFGQNGFSFLYLCSGILSLLVYRISDPLRVTWSSKKGFSDSFNIIVAFFIAVPIFFTLEAGLFRSDQFVYDSMSSLLKLPLPVSLFFCYLAIILLGNFHRATLALTVIFLFYMAMMVSTVLTSSFNPQLEKAKLLLLVQYLVPTFGLVLGMIYGWNEDHKHHLAKTMFFVFLCIVPAELLSTFILGTSLLTPYIYLISIYQHLQYVPILMASLFLMGLYSLWSTPKWRMLILIISPFFGVYVYASGSMMACFLSLIGCAIFPFLNIKNDPGGSQFFAKSSVFVLAVCSAILRKVWIPGSTSAYSQKFEGGKLVNLSERFDIWDFYLTQIISDKFVFLFGHSAPPARNIFPSAHNYYLDLAYNFGAIPTLIILGLIVITLVKIRSHIMEIFTSPHIFALAMIVIFLILDNLLKVGFRQPYPGILSFFLWGVLLIRLNKLQISKNSIPNKT
ncbi:MAG: hypothetical protein RL744_622 [Pseudomonadota bacterium]|jgi:hypothetical protein